MALQEGKVSDTNLTTSDKNSIHDTVQKIIQNIKSSKREFVGGSTLVEDLDAEGALKYHRRKSNRKNPKYFQKRKLVAGKSKSTSSRSFKIYQGFTDENHPAALNSFHEFTLPVDEDDFSLISSPTNTCKEESFELVLDDNGAYTIDPYIGPYDHKTLREENLQNNIDIQRNVEEFGGCQTISRNGCRLPWSWSGRRNGRGKKLKGIRGKRFSCGVLVANRRKSLSDSASTLHYQEPIQFEYVTDFSSSDCSYSKDETPLVRSPPHTNVLTLDSPLDDYGDSPHVNNRRFSELDLHPLIKTHHRTRKSGISEYETEEESLQMRTNENMLVNRSLSQKYSPKSFEELVGQSIIAQALSSAINKDKIAPFYLFHGPRGTGKTSAARIFGFSLNCMADCNAKPCGNCNGGKNKNKE